MQHYARVVVASNPPARFRILRMRKKNVCRFSASWMRLHSREERGKKNVRGTNVDILTSRVNFKIAR